MSRVERGLTLVEVLVGLAIVLILSALTFAAYGGVMAHAKQSTCLSNLGQIGKAFALYSDDHSGYGPQYITDTVVMEVPGTAGTRVLVSGNPKAFRDALLPYAGSKEVFFCPADPAQKTAQILRADGSERTNEFTSYQSVNLAWKASNSGGVAIRLDTASTSVPYLRDLVLRNLRAGKAYSYYTVHGNRINELFPDGRVKNVSLN